MLSFCRLNTGRTVSLSRGRLHGLEKICCLVGMGSYYDLNPRRLLNLRKEGIAVRAVIREAVS